MMAWKLHPVAYVQKIWDNVPKQFLTRNHNSKTFLTRISVPQSVRFQFLRECWCNWEIRADWENKVKRNLSGIINTLVEKGCIGNEWVKLHRIGRPEVLCTTFTWKHLWRSLFFVGVSIILLLEEITRKLSK